ncbi:hypothetical protein CKA32_000335 [Geitlerinema sp. FC II]|nr:hypothetical protein CKA32_000335 [Geitlerinema sp. FC II]
MSPLVVQKSPQTLHRREFDRLDRDLVTAEKTNRFKGRR